MNERNSQPKLGREETDIISRALAQSEMQAILPSDWIWITKSISLDVSSKEMVHQKKKKNKKRKKKKKTKRSNIYSLFMSLYVYSIPKYLTL